MLDSASKYFPKSGFELTEICNRTERKGTQWELGVLRDAT